MRYRGRIKGLGYILWHAKHELFHALLGIAWAWFLRELWGEFSVKWLILSIFGALLPDADHLLYFFSYGKTNWYSHQVKQLFKLRQWRNLVKFLSSGHKYNTELMTHNIFVVAIIILVSVISLIFDWKAWVVIFGAMLTHFIFDILDDLVFLGRLNSNWKRWGRPKIKTHEIVE